MPTMLDAIRGMQRGEIPPPPVATLVGFTLREAEPGRAVMELEADARHANPMGTLHGGILCDVTDADDQLVARATSTCMTLRGAQAAGR
jgi:acyl-coenzyme A thioesterase PaaI-like protein